MDVIGVGMFFLNLLGWMSLAQKLFGTSRTGSFFVGIQLLIFTLYVVALLNLLLLGVYLVEILGISVFCATLYEKRKSIRFLQTIRHSYYLIPFLAFTVTIPKDFRFTMSDEFPSWAANIKTMFAENSLGGINSATRTIAEGFYQSYPPFQQLFQYLFLKNTSWSESNVQTAQNILALTLLLGSAALILNQNSALIFPTWIASISLYFLFGFTMSNLLADGLLAVQFAACLGFTISNKGKMRDYLLLALLVSNLILIKPTGFILAFCALILSISVLASSRGVTNKLDAWKKLTILLSLPGITYLSWQLHLRLIQLNPGAESFSLASLASEQTRVRWTRTWASYKSNFFGSLHGEDNLAGISSTAPKVVQVFHISLFSILAILAVTHIFLALMTNQLEKKLALRNAILILSLAIFYQIFLLSLYMFFFGEYEGVRSAALVRYSGSFFLAWAILVIGMLMKQLGGLRFSSLLITATTFVVLLAAPSALAHEISGRYTDLNKLPDRLNVEKLLLPTLESISKNAKIYYVYQGSNGYEKYIYSYLVLPRGSNWSCPSLGKPLYEGDGWTCDLTLPRVLQGYDYLAVGKADLKFWQANTQFLSRGSLPSMRGLYRVSYESGSLQLAEVK
jgi:hypothetical protein